jgi:hypothetical protein
LDRSELGVFLFTAEQHDHDHAALAVLLGLNGLRVSEACATNIEDLGSDNQARSETDVSNGRPSTSVSPKPARSENGSWTATMSPRSTIERKKAVERARGALHKANTGIAAKYP